MNDEDAGVALPDAEPAADSGPMPDSGLFPTPCGSTTCTGPEFCHIRPIGPCTPRDGGTCPTGEEMCQRQMIQGCTPPLDRACSAIPTACTSNPKCACFLNQNLCPTMVAAACMNPQLQGVTVTCPFPP